MQLADIYSDIASIIRASVDALCRDGTSESHVIRVQNASKLGEKA